LIACLRQAILLLALFALSLSTARAEGILMARSTMEFDAALVVLKSSIEAHGYTVAHVQRCDGGMRGMGYEADNYKTVFFGKYDEITRLSKKYPELIPYLPLKMAIYAEGKESILAILNPIVLGEFIPDAELKIQLQRWHSDIKSVLADMR
jgi:uncharacterized protein (DUF302 family)